MGCTQQAHYFVCGDSLIVERKLLKSDVVASESFVALPLPRALT